MGAACFRICDKDYKSIDETINYLDKESEKRKKNGFKRLTVTINFVAAPSSLFPIFTDNKILIYVPNDKFKAGQNPITLVKAGAVYIDTKKSNGIIRIKKLNSDCTNVKIISIEEYDNRGIILEEDVLWVIYDNSPRNWHITSHCTTMLTFGDNYKGRKLFGELDT